MTSSKIFLYFCLSFVGGIFLNSLIKIPQLLMLGFLVFGIFLVSIFWKYQKFVVIGFCLLFLVLGVWRHQVAVLEKPNIIKGETSFTGIVCQEPDVRMNNVKLTVKFEDQSKVLVTTRTYPEYQYGDKLKIIGKLETPQEFEEGEEDKSSYSAERSEAGDKRSSATPFAVARDFNYKNYLAKDGIYSVMYFPEIELIERNQGNFIYTKILQFKNKLRESIDRNLSPPQSSILGALILGDKGRMSAELKQKLNLTGVRHITAISGMHVTILTSILMTLLIGLGFWRKHAFYFSIILITLFIIMTGLQPSAIRAGIMGGFFLISQYLGRMNVSSRTIIFAAAVMLAQNPLLLRLDVGFQLSFLAMMGIIYFLPIIQNWFQKFPGFLQGEENQFSSSPFAGAREFKNILAMTLSAQIFTLPILIYNFGYFSLIAPITNILILPFLPYLMGFGFIFSLAGTIFQPLGWILSWPSWLLLTYLTKIIDWFSGISWAYLTLEISWAWLFLLYLILGLITWRLNDIIKQ